MASEEDPLGMCDKAQGCFAENGGGRALLLFLWVLPVYNLFVYRAYDFIPDIERVRLLGVGISDLYLLVWVVVVSLPLANRRWRALLSDAYVLLFSLNLAVAIVADRFLGVSDAVIVDYLPASLLGLTIYLTASQTPQLVSGLRLAVKFSIGFYTGFAVLRVLTFPPIDLGRVNSVFTNANFYAFNMLHLFFLLHVLASGRSHRDILWKGLAIVGIVMSRTRSVVFLLPVLLFLQPRSRAIFLSCSIALAAMLFCPMILRINDLEQLRAANARVPMWRTIIERVEFNIWLGAGTSAVKTQELLPAFVDGERIGFYQPQNHYILLLVERGVLGLVLWGAALIVYARRLWPWREDPRIRAVLIYIMMLLTIQLVENEMFVSPLVMTILGIGTAIAQSYEALYRRPLDAPSISEALAPN